MSKKILLMTDIHITNHEINIIGLNPALRFRHCLEHASSYHADASHLFILGDLTHNGSYDEYKILERLLKNQPFPVTLMLGNHDNRSAFSAVFSNRAEPFQHGSQNFGKTKIIHLDTLDDSVKNRGSGLMCMQRMHWFEYNLGLGDGPILVLSHHHMLNSGFDGLDKIRLLNGNKIAGIIAASGRCKMVINGHIHRTIFSSYKGVPHATLKSTCHQTPLLLSSNDPELAVNESGGYGVLLLDGDTPVLHHVDFD